MNNSELQIIEKWQSDPSFRNWINKENEADIAKWDAYFNQNPQHIELMEVARFSMKIKPKSNTIDRQKSLDALSSLNKRINTSTNSNSANVKKLRYFKGWQIAASLLFIVASYWSYSTLDDTRNGTLLATQEDQKEIILADGTKVILNEHSTIQYSDTKEREVVLNGEAYFEVVKKPKTKATFRVITQDLTVTVLGTEFNVDSKDEQTSVYLDEGKVELNLGENETNVIQMNPGELVSYSKKANKVLENRKSKSLIHTAWKEKVILFEDASLSEALDVVSMVYDLTFESNLTQTNDQLFTGGIPVNDLDITLQTLKEVYQLNINKNEEKYILE